MPAEVTLPIAILICFLSAPFSRALSVTGAARGPPSICASVSAPAWLTPVFDYGKSPCVTHENTVLGYPRHPRRKLCWGGAGAAPAFVRGVLARAL